MVSRRQRFFTGPAPSLPGDTRLHAFAARTTGIFISVNVA
jgi:hypothetical protein